MPATSKFPSSSSRSAGSDGGHGPSRKPRAAPWRGPALLLVVLCAVQLIDAFDVAAMGPTLPKIQHDLGMSPSSLQWVVSAYVLGYGGFLLLGGRLADLFNRKRVLLAAMAAFILASIVGGIASSGDVLIGARLAKGIAAGFTAPAALAILLNTYDDEQQRHKALGTFLSVSAVGFTSGLVLGGVLASLSWRLVLFVPAALGLIASVAAAKIVPASDHRDGLERESVDVVGAFVVTTGLLALVFGVSRAATRGWTDDLTLASLAAAVALLVAFIQIERLRETPLVPLAIFRRPGLSRANSVGLLLQGGYIGWQFMTTLYLQDRLHWTPVEVGLMFAPGGFIVLLTAQRWAGRIATLGAWPIAAVGLLLTTIGFAWTLELGNVNSIVLFAIAQIVVGTGYTMAYVAMNVTAVASAQTQEQGLASGLFVGSLQVGAGVLLGVVASVFTTAGVGAGAYRSGILVTVAAAALASVIALAGFLRRGKAVPHLTIVNAQAVPNDSTPERMPEMRPVR